MGLRTPAGFISAFFDPLKNPDAPTDVTASPGSTDVSVSFTAPTNAGGSAITAYYAVASDGTTATAATSPITVSGLTAGTSYTFNVWALNSYGPGVWSSASNSASPAGQRGLFAGTNTIYYINLASTGNATYFGSTAVYNGPGGCASSTRGLFGGSIFTSTRSSIIDYVTIASTGNATTFGNLTSARYGIGGCSNSTRGLFGGGNTAAGNVGTIDYVTIATLGNAASFGALYGGILYNAPGACASPTRGVWGGGLTSGTTTTSYMSYVTIATLGDATYFGNLTQARFILSGASNSTRGVFDGGYNYSIGALSRIDYITIATEGNATTFGSLSSGWQYTAACSSPTIAVFASAVTQGTSEYITFASTGNSTTFGELYVGSNGIAGCSNCHGGI